jgi:hypothetical protein
MQQRYIRIVALTALMFAFTGTSFAAWVESKHQGMVVRHPKGWKVYWAERGFSVEHPEDRMTWCLTQWEQLQGSSRQLAEAVVQRATSQVSDVKRMQQKQVSQRPDIYGIKFSGVFKGTPLTSLVLTATEDGRNFVIRQFSSPAKQYDEIKHTLIPILCSLRSQSEASGRADAKSGGWQVIQSPRGYWRFTAPAGWRIFGNPTDEPVMASIGSHDGSAGTAVGLSSGSGEHWELLRARFGPNLGMTPQGRQMQYLPLMPAAQLFQQVLVPAKQMRVQDLRVESLQAVTNQQARYKISFSTPQGARFVKEGFIISWSLPYPGYGDFNPFNDYSVNSTPQKFESIKKELWQILSSFEPSPNFGAPLIQIWAKMRNENLQAMTNMALQNMQTNKQIMAQHVGIAQQRPGMMAQQGQGWINAVTGQEVVRDPQTGQRWQVPVGGQYIYGRNTGEIIQADRPLQTHELPEGFKQFEPVK